jgi:hypothetical protein
VQVGEELDAILAREQLIHYLAEMIATKAKGKNVWKKLSKNYQKLLNSLQKVITFFERVRRGR